MQSAYTEPMGRETGNIDAAPHRAAGTAWCVFRLRETHFFIGIREGRP